MTTVVFCAVLLAAILHATWNALVKSGLDKRTSVGAVVLGHVPIAVVAVSLPPLPDLASLPYLALGLAAHLGYQAFLTRSYEMGDLTQVYPIARGSAPLIVTLVSVTVLSVELSAMQLLAIGVLLCGIFGLAFGRQGDGARNLQAAGVALITGLFIAGYSLADGLGARLSGSPVAYYSWLSIFNGAIWAAYLRWRAPGTLTRIATEGRQVFVIGGIASWAAYALVVWSFAQAPIALVTALRETSVVFALLIGVVLMGERMTGVKLFATCAAVVGVVLLRLAG